VARKERPPAFRPAEASFHGPLALAVGRSLGAALGLALALATNASAVIEGTNGRIAFERHSGGQSDVYITPVDITLETFPTEMLDALPLIADPTTSEANPAWGPQASEAGTSPLAYDSDQSGTGNLDGDREIWILPTSGPLENFSDHPAHDSQPAWEPGGAAIAFVRNVAGSGDIVIKSRVGEEVETNVTASPEDETNPTWSDLGNQLTFERTTNDGRREIRVMRVIHPAAGGDYALDDPRDITAGEPSSFEPSWFHFDETAAGGTTQEEGGGASGPPVPCEGDEAGPPECVFAPADRIAFAGLDVDPPGDLEVFFASHEATLLERPFHDLASKTTWQLTDNAVRDAAPTWSPRGDLLAFERGDGGGISIYVMTQDAGDPLDVSVEGARAPVRVPAGAADRNPAWEALALADVTNRIPCGRRTRRRVCQAKPRIASAAATPAPTVGREPPPTTTGSRCTHPGGPGPDRLFGTPRNDVLCGEGGRDVLLGRGGADRLRGGSGDDRLRGGPGSDRLWGEGGADRMFGEAGTDRLFGGSGGDTIVGGPGRDWLFGETGPDRLRSRDGQRDRLFGGSGDDLASLDRRGDRVRGIAPSER
jgi:hypothetical protein